MAKMSPSTFDPLLRYVNVRLQQGVPIVDADLNELDDVRKFELRAFLKWYVGDGVPEGNDGFGIIGGLANDFTITAGPQRSAGATGIEAGLRSVGRLIVDGLDAIIADDVRYSAQPLHEDRPGAAALAARWQVPVLPRLKTLPKGGANLAYLDLWERLVTPDEAPELVHAGLGVETGARVRREWVVRVTDAAAVPKTGDLDYLPGHLYYPLAVLVRTPEKDLIDLGDVLDRRERRLYLPPAHLLADTLGVDDLADYRRGGGRPLVNLREAINALLIGQLPATPEIPVSVVDNPDLLKRGCVVDSRGRLVVVWQGSRGTAGTNQVVASRLDPALFDPERPETGFAPAVMVTTGTDPHNEPTAVALPNGDIVIAYQNGVSGADNLDVKMKRGRFEELGGPGLVETTIAATPGVADQNAVAVRNGDQIVFLTYQSAASPRWSYQRYVHGSNTLQDVNPVGLTDPTSSRDLHAAVPTGGTVVWVAAVITSATTGMQFLRFRDGTVDSKSALTTTSPASDLFVLANSDSQAQVFYRERSAGQESIRSVTLTADVTTAPVPTTVSGTDQYDSQPTALRDTDGTVYLAYTRSIKTSPTTAPGDIVLRRRNAVTGEWSQPQLLVTGAASDQRPNLVKVPGQGIWLVFASDRNKGNTSLYAKRVITAI